MTVTINRNVLIFVVALVVLGVAGYFFGSRMGGGSEQTAAATSVPGLPADLGANPQVTQPTAPPATDNAPRIAMEEFKKMFDDKADMVVVDVRTPDQYAAGHIAGAVNIPEAEVTARLAELPQGKHIVLYCA